MNRESTLVHQDEVDLWELLEAIWEGRWFVALGAGLFVAVGVAYAFLAPEWYRAEIILAPTEQRTPAGGALAGFGLSGIAELAGINVQNTSSQQPVAVLESKAFASEFITDLHLMPELLNVLWLHSRPPDIRDAVKVFDERVRTVTQETQTGLVTLSIRWRDPDSAALWANMLIKRLNDRLRRRAEEEAERNIAFLKNEFTATRIVSLQQSVASLLEAEMQKLMLAQGNEEFAFKVIDPAVPPIEQDTPQRALITVISLFAGGILSILFLLVRKAIQSRPRK